MSDRTVDRIIKAAAGAGLSGEAFSGHSLRRGALTEMARRGGTPYELMALSRHKSMSMTLEYIDDAAVTVPSRLLLGFADEEE